MIHPIARYLVVGFLVLPGVIGTSLPAAEPVPAPAPAAAPVVPPPAEKPWDASIALGFNLTSGNSETMLLTLAYRAKKEWAQDIWSLGADGAYGQDHGNKNNEKAGAFTEYKRLLTERLYASFHIDILHDAIANLEYRLTVGPALGYFFIKSPVTQLNAEIGPSYVVEKTDVQHPNQPAPPPPNPRYITSETISYLALRLAERFEHQFTNKAKIWQALEFLPQVDDFNNYLVNAEAGAEVVLNGSLNIRVVGQDKYNNQPAPNSKNNDIALLTALVYKFH